jgi:hypothetical protein
VKALPKTGLKLANAYHGLIERSVFLARRKADCCFLWNTRSTVFQILCLRTTPCRHTVHVGLQVLTAVGMIEYCLLGGVAVALSVQRLATGWTTEVSQFESR